jgi:hypothetical protein
LVVLPSEHPYSRENGSAAENAARAILESRGNTPRLYRNTLVFLAADKLRMQDLDEAVRRCLAWASILAEKDTLDLSPFQVRQAETQRQAADSAVTARLPETYQWVLVPEQKTPQSAVQWHAIRLSGSDALAVRASKKLKNDELFVTSLGSTILRKHLDDVPLWRGDHVAVRQMVEDFTRYLYLPRLAGPEVLVQAMRDGLALLTWHSDTFAYAESFDDAAGRYRGLRAGQGVMVSAEDAGLIVKPEVARRQLDAEVLQPGKDPKDSGAETTSAPDSPEPPVSRIARRFHGTVSLNPKRVGLDASRIAEEVVAHLAVQPGAEVSVTLEISAQLPNGANEQTVRVVTENSRTLKFTSHEFEKE